jgi:hypothetical protein
MLAFGHAPVGVAASAPARAACLTTRAAAPRLRVMLPLFMFCCIMVSPVVPLLAVLRRCGQIRADENSRDEQH